MRRSLVAAMVVTVIAFSAAPAFAHELGRRDPFEPLIKEETGATGPVVIGTDGTVDTGTTTVVDTSGVTDGIADTGADPQPWLVAAFVLITVGAGSIVWARLRDPRLGVRGPNLT